MRGQVGGDEEHNHANVHQAELDAELGAENGADYDAAIAAEPPNVSCVREPQKQASVTVSQQGARRRGKEQDGRRAWRTKEA